jgi:hypothetical protein
MEECPECGKEYKNLGQHWRYSPPHRPELTQKQLEITTGLLMGDGYIYANTKNAELRVEMISSNYLEYLDNIFGCLGRGLSMTLTAVESAKNNRDTGFSPNAKEENYSDVYQWETRVHPKFNEFREWYSSGKKVWPEDIELTPTVLKHWYVGDGHYHNSRSHNHIQISVSNEVKNTEKVFKYFSNVGLPQPSNHHISEQIKSENKKCDIVWGIEESYELWDYMGEPLPDFEYKWPDQYR